MRRRCGCELVIVSALAVASCLLLLACLLARLLEAILELRSFVRFRRAHPPSVSEMYEASQFQKEPHSITKSTQAYHQVVWGASGQEVFERQWGLGKGAGEVMKPFG